MTLAIPVLDRLQDCFDPISPRDLASLELDLRVTFPADYREFLLEFNAGIFRHWVSFRVRSSSQFVDIAYVESILGIIRDERWSNSDIRATNARFAQQIPAALLAIGSSFSYPICLGVACENYGEICLWDHLHTKPNVYLIADTFSEFLLQLSPAEEGENCVEQLPIFQAVERGNLLPVSEYLVHGGKVDGRNEQGHTLLMCAARTSWPKIVLLLLDQGADPNARDRDERTPLYHAVMGQSNDSVKLLLSARADATLHDHRGLTLVGLAKEHAYYRIADTLEKHGGRS